MISFFIFLYGWFEFGFEIYRRGFLRSLGFRFLGT